MKHAVRDIPTLLSRLSLPSQGVPAAAERFPVFVPPSLLKRIEVGNTHDPILRQILPILDEDREIPGFTNDPLAELADPIRAAAVQNPVLQKYQGRALLVTTGVCGVHCRYCFRRHFPYQALPQNRVEWSEWLTPLRQDTSIREVILSGGDPLVLNDLSLQRLCDGLREISHVRWLRIHSRMPVVIPGRITARLLDSLSGFANTTLVLHINHANEIDGNVRQAVQQLKQTGVSVLNQSVLLAGVNDSLETLSQLSIQLVESGIQPYYLHQLDRVQGAAHFEVTHQRGKELMQALRALLPGHAVPQYVQEIPGEPWKTLIPYT